MNTAVSTATPHGLPPAACCLPSLRIGPIDIGFPVVQAALSGYSDAAMRIIARRLGAPYTLCEVLLDQFVDTAGHSKKNQRRLQVTDEEHPVGGQLMGANPDDFAPAAQQLVKSGFDVIDINFGCPVKKVLGRCRGGFLLGQVETALEIVSRVRDAVPPHVPVTVKMRRGLDDSCRKPREFLCDLRRRVSSAAWRRLRCMGAPCSSATSAPAIGNSCAK